MKSTLLEEPLATGARNTVAIRTTLAELISKHGTRKQKNIDDRLRTLVEKASYIGIELKEDLEDPRRPITPNMEPMIENDRDKRR